MVLSIIYLLLLWAGLTAGVLFAEERGYFAFELRFGSSQQHVIKLGKFPPKRSRKPKGAV